MSGKFLDWIITGFDNIRFYSKMLLKIIAASPLLIGVTILILLDWIFE